MKRLLTIAIVALWCMLAQAAEPVRVACVGNSITYGTSIADPDTYSYPSQLALLLGDGYQVGRFGKPGATLLQKGHRPYTQQEEYQAALAFNPDIVVIHLGVNDTDPRDWPLYGDEFAADYAALIDAFRAQNPAVRVIVARLTPIRVGHKRYKSGTRQWRDLIQQQIDNVAAAKGCEVIDFGATLRDHQQLLHDNVHPNEQGYKMLAETVYRGITGDYGGLQMPITYTDGMVLQRYKPLHIRGTTDAGATVTVSIGPGNTATATANNHGEWVAELKPMSEGTGYTMTVSDGTKTLTYSDVAVGEVWLASGQSNMAFRLGQAATASEDAPKAADPNLRFFDMKGRYNTNKERWSDEALERVNNLDYYEPTTWQASTPATARRMSAIAYYFGRMLRDSLDVPVGIIQNAIGGSPCEAWIDVETLEHAMPEVMHNWRTNDYVYSWVQTRAADNSGTDALQRHPYGPTYLFASGIRPLGAYPIAGVIWYQGESNEHNVEVFEELFPLLVESFRKNWDEPMLPFYYTQLSSISRPSWPSMRDAQRRLMGTVAGTGMAVSHDYGDSLDVHPRNKRPIGERLGRWALSNTYSRGVVPSGPLPVTAERHGNAVVVTMDYGHDMHAADGGDIQTFEIAEVDGFYFPAVAQVSDNKITLTSMHITTPRFVRYAWQPYTHGNLVNGSGLPASTFKMEVQETADREAGIASGVSACYAGHADGLLISAGGCNFPVNPMAPDSKKKFYQGIYAYAPTAEGPVTWQRIGDLPQAMAYGASATTPMGIVLVGGTTPQGALSDAWLLTVADGKATTTPLPALPCTIDNMSACAIGNVVYVAGGNCDGAPSNKLWRLDVANSGQGWQELTPFPGNARVQPVLAGAVTAKGEPCLYLWGGFAGSGSAATLNTDGLAYNIAKKKWTAVAGPVDAGGQALTLAGGAACTMADGRIAAVGGVNKDVFLEAIRCQAPDYLSHPIEWYRFNDHLTVFDPQTQTWTVAGRDADTARAGAAIVAMPDGTAYLIGGELKPRIRTPYIAKIQLDK